MIWNHAKEKKIKSTAGSNLLWRYTKLDQRSFVVAVIIRCIAVAFSVVTPLLASRVIADLAISEYLIVVIVAGGLAVLKITGSISNQVASFYYKRVYVKAIEQLHNDIADAILRMKLSVIDKNGTGVFVKRMNDDSEEVALGAINMTDRLVSVVEVVGVLGATAIISWKIFLFEIITFVILIVWEKLFTKAIKPYMAESRRANEKHVTLIIETIRAHLDIKALNCEKRFLQELRTSDENVDRLYLARILRTFFNDRNFAVYKGIVDFVFIVLLVLMCMKGQFFPVTAIILFNYHSQLSGGTDTFSELADVMRNVRISTERIETLFDDAKYPKNIYGNVSKDKLEGDIEFKGVDFGYLNGDDEVRVDVFRDLNLHIRPGENVSFVGASGCGKSTILKLINRFYDPDQGTVSIDGIDAREYDKDTLRGNITLINQNTYIFDRTIRENLKLFKPDLTEAEMIAACKAACIHDDIMKFPDGYDTNVGEGGIVLSGGQSQRIAFVRAILRDSPIIMLDESTSALDNITQSSVLRYMKQIGKDKTMITVAHRLSTIVDCDRIYFIEDGHIAAQGTHEELMKYSEGYRGLYNTEGSENEE